MKQKVGLIMGLLMGICPPLFAQRYCVINSQYILQQIPQYTQAQQELDSISTSWQKELDAKKLVIANMYKSYQAEQVMLTEDLKKKRQQEIMGQEKALQDLQNKLFGYQGELFKKREELVKPIQDEVYNAVQQMAADRLYDFVLDKSGGISVFYSDPRLDQSQEVLRILGIKK
ncbi:MAG: OmpH/Skp family outer membrane protein [Chitinophagaceae bacterium]